MKTSQLTLWMFPVTVLAIGFAGWLNFAAPLELTEGIVQKTMYVHVPAALNAYLALIVAVIAAIGFLRNRSRAWDRVALCSMEIGAVYCTIVLLTGPVWGRAMWGVWWQWDARLTSTLVLWFMFVGYLVVRVLAPDRETGAKWSAVVAIMALLDAYLVHESVQWWRTLHPLPKFSTGGLPDPMMRHAFESGWLAFAILYVFLLFLRLSVEKLSDDLEAAEAKT